MGREYEIGPFAYNTDHISNVNNVGLKHADGTPLDESLLDEDEGWKRVKMYTEDGASIELEKWMSIELTIGGIRPLQQGEIPFPEELIEEGRVAFRYGGKLYNLTVVE